MMTERSTKDDKFENDRKKKKKKKKKVYVFRTVFKEKAGEKTIPKSLLFLRFSLCAFQHHEENPKNILSL